jgi:hypothetical protein
VDGKTTELWNGADGRVIAGPVPAPDGRELAFTVQRAERFQLYAIRSDGPAWASTGPRVKAPSCASCEATLRTTMASGDGTARGHDLHCWRRESHHAPLLSGD